MVLNAGCTPRDQRGGDGHVKVRLSPEHRKPQRCSRRLSAGNEDSETLSGNEEKSWHVIVARVVDRKREGSPGP